MIRITYRIPSAFWNQFGTRHMEALAAALLIAPKRGPFDSTTTTFNPFTSCYFSLKIDGSIIFKINIRGPAIKKTLFFFQSCHQKRKKNYKISVLMHRPDCDIMNSSSFLMKGQCGYFISAKQMTTYMRIWSSAEIGNHIKWDIIFLFMLIIILNDDHYIILGQQHIIICEARVVKMAQGLK